MNDNTTDRDLISEAQLSITSIFIPFSISRNKDQNNVSLNWKVTMLCKGKKLFDFDYSAGYGHCPADKKQWEDSYIKKEAIRYECMKGKEAEFISKGSNGATFRSGKIIGPSSRMVITSIFMDANAINSGSFEYWCGDMGYDSDSIKAKKIYDDCIEKAIILRNTLGSELFDALVEMSMNE